jgi:acyl-coenzyme A thioesterase PaaI-like protein
MTKSPAPPAAEFEPEFIAALQHLFEEQINFNKAIGLRVTSVKAEGVTGRLDMKPDLVGNYLHNRLHGGVICTALDSLGGLAVLAAGGARHMNEPPLKRMERFIKLGTIDLRIDFLRPAVGTFFTMRAEVLRLGSRVASTRMEFMDAEGSLLATGAGAYIVS